MNLFDELKNQIVTGLERKAVTSCSKWAQLYRIMGQPVPGPYSFTYHPWCKDMHDCEEETMVGMKAAQMGYTEVALNKTFYAMDILGQSVLYILPSSHPDAGDFSSSRFDPAVELSPHISSMFSDVKNVGHKRAGSASLYIRGSRSRAQLKSLPVGMMIFDEVDEMTQENIPLAFERMSGQREKQAFLLSTPTIDKHGIDYYFKLSSQDHFFFKCPCCSKWTEFVFPDCLVITAEDILDSRIKESYYICKECRNTLPHEDKVNFLSTGKWVPSYTDRDVRGFAVSQMYSMMVAGRPAELATAYLKGMTNPADEQEFYNSKLGLTHAVEGAKVTDKMIDECIGGYTIYDEQQVTTFTTMGVDVGTWLHYEIAHWVMNHNETIKDINLLSKCKVLRMGKVLNFEELYDLMRKFRINFCVIDANPERRKALEFAKKFEGHVKLCFYGRGIHSKQIHVHADEEYTLTVDRTSWIDISLGRFKTKTIKIPKDTPLEYKEQIKAPVRIYKKENDGNLIGEYVKADKDMDHFAHARTYNEIALPMGASLLQSRDVTDFL